jgi:hypothetical protein
MTPRRYSGTCHCGNIQIEFESTLRPDEFRPRSCDCSFCTKHGAKYVSDPQGKLTITVRQHNQLNRYRQGSESAEFLICRKCGVLAAVVYSEDAKLYGTVNGRIIDDGGAFGQDVAVSPWKLGGEKRTRWKELWFADVSIL